MVTWSTAIPRFSQQLFDISVGQPVAEIPADCHDDHVRRIRNPANADRGECTQHGRRGISSLCRAHHPSTHHPGETSPAGYSPRCGLGWSKVLWKLVLEPIFEADFLPCSYGFRPNRRAHDAVAEVRHFTSHSYEWIVEGDIKACFDEISHPALMDRVRNRVGDKRVLALVKA